MFLVVELLELDKGKGNKLIEILKKQLVEGECVVGVVVVVEGKGEVMMYVGQCKFMLKWVDLVEYGGNCVICGGVLLCGLCCVEWIEIIG